MIKIENTQVFGWEAAIRGMRNPYNSWDKIDTIFDGDKWCIGKNDLNVMKFLSKAGNDHSKFLRMINVTCDITAPLYFWKEFDTYKVGTVANSCSTMHKIADKEFTLEDFSHEYLFDEDNLGAKIYSLGIMRQLIIALNNARDSYLKTKDKRYWWQMIQLLPSSYNQRRTIQLNYQVLKNIYFARKNHKLDEWHDFCDWIETLPYFKEIVIGDN